VTHLSPQFLDGINSPPTDDDVLELHARLGRLSSWWLDEDCLSRIRTIEGAASCPTPELLAGEFAVLLKGTISRAWLQPAFAVPMRWTSESDRDDPRLPTSFRQLAAQIRRIAADSMKSRTASALQVDRFFLVLGEGCPDLSAQKIPAESAGAAMYAALHCAVHAVQPDRTKTASATLTLFGLEPVDGIDEKARAASRLGITQLLVAADQKHSCGDGVDSLRIVHAAGATPNEQRAQLLELFDTPPYDAPYKARRDWYNRTPTRRRSEFYAAQLVREIAERAREQVALPDLDTLVICAGRVVEPLLLAAEAMRANRVILLHFDQGEMSAIERSRPLFDYLTHKPQVESIPLHREIGQDALHALLRERLSPLERIGIDITPGPKDIAIYLERFSRAWTGTTPCSFTYITSHTDNGRAIYGELDRVVVLNP